ncbi:zinc-binding dehydrogenase [candidate division KSB3 bacterium]|uniref:Zinc-binding dehydrogenase n=1 Tax=candidate division KSB3 bacterium TaxID=2044937 RepID=A0A9D5Q682_9BACT|nr:zinc-binding dehydrogenase [candidate division KSB3 bacterium]MBD3324646.1 zinc-binding dehydrogenase [candidate division KSB3 bacterium]
MQAVLVNEAGDADHLTLGSYPMPRPAEDELLVKVKATALNRADVMQRQGLYPPPKGASPILGLEMAGVVETVGSQCQGWQPGDRVFGLLPGGGYAEYAVIPGAMAMPIPEHFSFEDAAAITEVFLTAYQCLFWIARLQAGETVLIHAGASGVGTAAIQLVKAFGARAIVTAGTAQKLDACRNLGADVAINYKEGRFAEKVFEATDGQGVQVILDFVAAAYWEQNLTALAIDGRMVIIAALGGTKVDQVDLGSILKKRLQITGTSLRVRSLEYKIQLTREFADFALPRFADGRLKPVIDRVFAWDAVQEAHRYMEANKNIGKIVLTLP